MPRRIEQGIVNSILTYLTLKHVPHCHVRNMGVIYGRNGDGSLRFGRSRFNQRGVPDIFAFLNGKSYGIECKAPDGKVSREQAEWLSHFHARGGGEIIIARDLDDVRRVMKI